MGKAIYVQETYCKREDAENSEGEFFTKLIHIGETGVFEAWTNDRGKLFRSLQREYGRCTGAVYTERPNGKARRIGWTFQKRVRYEDCNETYLREVWVTLHARMPKTTTKYYYR